MPILPTGGLSIFINIAVVLCGALVKFMRKNGMVILGFPLLGALVIEKKYDSVWRHTVGYGVATSIFVFLITLTSYSLVTRFSNDSNMLLIVGNVIAENVELPRVDATGFNELYESEVLPLFSLTLQK